MLLLMIISIFVLCFILFYFVLNAIFSRKIQIAKRIEEFESVIQEDKMEFTFKAFLGGFGKGFARFTPQNKLKKLQTKLDNSGLSRKFSPTEWMVLNNLISYSAAIAFSLLLWFTTEIALVQNIILSLFIVGLTKYIIHFIMLRKMKGRKGEMLRELPFTLDLVTVSVEAGLSFDGAILKVVQTRNNALSDEFEKLLKEIKIGMVRRVALKNMMKRVNLDELNTLLVAVIQADELGVSISKVLKVQAEFIRENRKMRAREKAMKAPVKMLFPLIFFIFPSIFVIILGPAVIKMMTMFM